MKALFFAATALAFAATPAQAQLLGSGPNIGGSIGSAIGSTVDTATPVRSATRIVRSTADSVESTTSASVDGNAASEGSQNVDSGNGSVSANRSANTGLTGNVHQLARIPMTTAGSSASGSGQASGNGSAQAQLIGTDAVSGLANGGVSQAQSTVGTARGAAQSAAGRAQNSATGLTSVAAGSASANGSGNASGTSALTSMPLAVAGSGATAGQGAFGVTPGMPVFAPSGERIGKVREVVANGRGQVQQVLVDINGTRTLVPADQFSANGSALVLGSGEGQVNQKDAEPEAQEPRGDTAAQ